MSYVPPNDPTPAIAGTVRVLFFGSLAEVMGRERLVTISKRGCSLSQLRRRVASLVEGGREVLLRRDVRGSIDHLIVPDTARVRQGCEVAFLPIFSGG